MMLGNTLKFGLAFGLVATFLVACQQENRVDTDLVEAEARLDVADVYRAQGQFRSSVIETQNALQLAPESDRALRLQAELMLDVGDYGQAIAYLRQIGERFPASNDIQLLLAQAHLEGGDPQQALAVLSAADSSGTAQGNWLLGNAYASLNNYELAKQAFEAALALDGNHIGSLIGLSKVAYLEQDPEAAAGFVDRAVAANPGDLDLAIWRGDLAVLQGRYPEAEAAYFEALDQMGTYDTMTAKRFRALNAVVIPLQMQQKNDEALRFSQIIAATPQGQVQQAYSNAVELFQQGDYEEAQQALLETLALAPNNPDSNILLGFTNYALGDYAAAEQSLSNLVASVTSSPQPVKVLAASHLQLGDPDAALAVLNEAREAFPEDASLLAMIGLSQQQAGDLDASIASLNEALALDSASIEARLSLAGSYVMQGNLEAASGELRNTLGLDPENLLAKTNLVSLLLANGQAAAAQEEIQGWLDTAPDSVIDNNLAGVVAINRGDAGAARDYLNRSIASEPGNIQALLLLSRIAVNAQDFAEAESRLAEAVSRDPTNPTVLATILDLGIQNASVGEKFQQVSRIVADYPGAFMPALVLSQYQARVGDFVNALENARVAHARGANSTTEDNLAGIMSQYALASSQSPANSPAASLIGEALELKGNNIALLSQASLLAARGGNEAQARSYLARIEELAGDSAASLLAQGDLEMALGDTESALGSYQAAWERYKDPSAAGKAYQSLGMLQRLEEASNLLDDWLQEAPEDAPANLLHGTNLLAEGQDEDAIRHYELAYQALPNNIVVLNNLAWLYQDSNTSRALELAAQAARLYPNVAEVLDTYGWITFKAGNREEARRILQRAQSIAPDSPAIIEHLEAVNR